jgi:hypothetical protein
MSNEKQQLLVTSFLEQAEEEDERLSSKLSKLDDEGRTNLAGVLGRFNAKGHKTLGTEERMLAYRVLTRLKYADTQSLVITNRILDYLDLNANAVLEADEMDICLKILEAFAKAESDNETLSRRELKMLYAALRYLDDNNSHVLDGDARYKLLDALDDPRRFIERQAQDNPHWPSADD